MAKIILPTYVTKQPSTGKTVKFRPFTVKEEKSLLLALQENDIGTVSEAIKNVISVCTDGAIDIDNTPYYDIEYLFLQIRAKSIGEVINLVGSCGCGSNNTTNFSTDIGDVIIDPIPLGNVKISIPDTLYTIEFRHPSIDDFVKIHESNGDYGEHVVANCMVTIFTDDEIMNWSYDEKLEFVLSMTTKQQKDIAHFLKNMPMVKLPASYVCKHCNELHDNNISGFESFFV